MVAISSVLLLSALSAFSLANPVSNDPTAKTHKLKVDGYKEGGCFEVLPAEGGTLYESDPGMTLESCASFCSAYPHFLVGNGMDCGCLSTVIHKDLKKMTGCTTACGGDASEICGGAELSNLFSKHQTPAN